MSIRGPCRRVLAAIGALVGAATIGAAPGYAATFTVTSTSDTGAGSLREAIGFANGAAGADTIVFGSGVTGTITLGSSLPSISDALTITGPGAASLSINGAGAYRVLEVLSGASLTLSGVTVSNGYGQNGGGVFNSGTLNVSSSAFSGNNVYEYGGAIYNEGTIALSNSTLSTNQAGLGGGAIANVTGTITVTNSTFSNNTTCCNGGGITNFVSGTLTVTGSTFSGNSGSAGGALHNNGSLTVVNSTFSANTAGFYGGGGIYSSYGALTVTNATFSGNSAGTLGGGGIRNGGFGTVSVYNAIVANSPTGGNCDGTITGAGNLSWPDATCGGINQNPLLDPLGLQSNGGPTQTIALQSGSPAIDAAVSCPPPTTDQRGVSRPQGSACDIGAYEADVMTVAIDIKPGDPSNVINVSKNGVITVAVLSTPTFNAANVNPATTCFGDAEDASQRDCTVASGTVLQDVNKDKLKDLVLHYEAQQTGIDVGDTTACLTGALFNGTGIQGCDSISTK